MRGILQKRPKIDEYVNQISELIENKNRRFGRYITGLNHVNLIIFDCEDGLLGAPRDAFHRLFFRPKLEKVLMNSGFREVFLITELGEFNSSKKVYIPLKMVFLIAEVFFFDYIMDKEYPDKLMAYPEKRLSWHAEYLKWRGAKDIYFKYVPD